MTAGNGPVEPGQPGQPGQHRVDEEIPTAAVETTLHEERAVTGTELAESGSVHVRKHVSTFPVEQTVPRSVEHVDTTGREPAVEGDDGEVRTLPDGSVSIPVFEEVLVVTKKLVVRERVVVRKNTVIDEHTLRTELRREHVTVDVDDEVAGRVTDATRPVEQPPLDQHPAAPTSPDQPQP